MEQSRRLPSPSGFDEATARANALKELEQVYERPQGDQEYAKQESTNVYHLHFQEKDSGRKGFTVRYRHSTSSSFDEDEVKVPAKKDTPSYEVVHYSPNAGGNRALVEISFIVDEVHPETIEAVNNDIARKAEPEIVEASGRKRASFYVKHQADGKGRLEERDHFWVKLTPPPAAGKREPVNLEIKLSPRPVITALTIDKPPLSDDSRGSRITIEGINLQNVQKVIVAGQEAEIVGTPENYALQVTLKKGVFIKEEQGVKIPVTLTAKDGTTASAGITIKRPFAATSEDLRKSSAERSIRAKSEGSRKR